VQRLNKASLPLITDSQGTSLGAYPNFQTVSRRDCMKRDVGW
jgi:hypothetical protein